MITSATARTAIQENDDDQGEEGQIEQEAEEVLDRVAEYWFRRHHVSNTTTTPAYSVCKYSRLA